MGFPPPLVPHINCEPRRPLPTERWDWVVCRNALWVNRLWSAIYPYHTWGLDRSLPRPHLARRQERRYTAHRSPKRGPLECLTRIGPPKGTLTSSARKPFSLQKFRPLIDELAYKLSSTLMVGFKNHGNLTLRQKNFNVILSKSRVTIERAYALLKGRFRRLKKFFF
jgi:hypothetical protein